MFAENLHSLKAALWRWRKENRNTTANHSYSHNQGYQILQEGNVDVLPTLHVDTLVALKRNSIRKVKSEVFCQVWWLMPIISALWEAEVGRSRGQESETILANMVKPRLY